jgi:eukaryotic-like serine/threonine-protein kinase
MAEEPRKTLKLEVESFPLRPGDRVSGKYVVDEIIGEGGVAIVVAAQNLELDERVALKFLRPEMLNQTEIVARFMLEAKAACSIKSEYVATVYDVGTYKSADDTYASPYLVMEYLEGSDLDAVLAERGRLERREATEYAMQACEALAAAHARGIVHRDIKPANLFVMNRGGMRSIKVLDFGISKAVLAGSILGNTVPLVDTISLMGSPLYMSPEQVRSASSVDPRSDVWSLGIVLYEMLTGKSPFKRASLTEICAAILEAKIPPLDEETGIVLPAGYADVVGRCLRKNPADRFQNVAELASALLPFAPSRSRICAERAARALVSAGVLEPDSIRFSSAPPPSQDSLPVVVAPPIDRLYAPKSQPRGSDVVGTVLAEEREKAANVGVASPDPADEPDETPATISSSSPLAWARGRPESRNGASFEAVAGSATASAAVAPRAALASAPSTVQPARSRIDADVEDYARARSRKRRTPALVAAVLGSLLVAFVAAGFVVRSGERGGGRTASALPSTAILTPAATPPPMPAPAPAPAPAPTPTAEDSVASPVAKLPPAPSPPSGRPRSRPVRMPVIGGTTTPTAVTEHNAAPSADCSPPYYFVGTKKVFKAQCL